MKKLASYYLIGILTFSVLKIWSIDFQNYMYYLWESGKDVLVWIAFLFLCDRKSMHYVACVFAISSFRFVLELGCTLTGCNINDSIIVDMLFMLCIASVVFIWVKDFLLKKK